MIDFLCVEASLANHLFERREGRDKAGIGKGGKEKKSRAKGT